jgi:hypothetical protein
MSRGEFESVAMAVLAPFLLLWALGSYAFDRARGK